MPETKIFFASFWLDKADQPLTPFRVITSDEIAAGEVRPNPAMAKWLCGGNYTWLCKQVLYYCKELERAGKAPQHADRLLREVLLQLFLDRQVQVEQVEMTEIPIGYVGVVISFVGKAHEDVSGEEFKHGDLVTH